MRAAESWQGMLGQLKALKKLSDYAHNAKNPTDRTMDMMALKECYKFTRNSARVVITALCSSDADCEEVVLKLKVGNLWCKSKPCHRVFLQVF